MITLLITGVGGPLGQALIKAARMSALPARIIGTDRHPLSIGLGWVDQGHVIASSSERDAYLAAIQQICASEHVTLVLPGSDTELEILSSAAESLCSETGAIVVCSKPEVLQIGLDKCATCGFLERNGLNFPAYATLQDAAAVHALIAQFGFPLLAKPCRGSGSRGVTKVRDHSDLAYLRTLSTEIIVQEYLAPDDEEYTVAVYTQRDGKQAGSICFKRELVAGNTYRAFVNQNATVIAEAEAVARSLGAIGPCNVQLRLTARGPVTFEINPRFSGTTAMRAHFGYNEVEMAMRDHALGLPVPKPLVRPGIALRFWDEIYLGADGLPERAPHVAKKATLHAYGTADRSEWLNALHRTTQHDVYFLPSYHELAEQRGEGEARLFVYEDGEYTVALPLMLRRVAEVPELNGSAGEWRDATSVYGYGGPVSSHAQLPPEVVRGFQESLGKAMRDGQVIGVFSRLHPLLEQRTLLDGLGVCHAGGQTVSIDLTRPLEQQRSQYRENVRRRLNRLTRDGATCVRDPEKKHLPEFVSIYHETMRRVAAQQTYFFDKAYFDGLAASLDRALQLFVVRDAREEIIAAGLFMLCDGVVQYHLGGTRDDALKFSPTALLFDTVRLWANEHRARIFHLGGGLGSHEDSLFHFKSGFSDRRHDFATWRWVIAPDVYAALSAERARWNNANAAEPISHEFFPTYRCATRPAGPVPIFAHDGLTISSKEVTANG
ncbi:MAG: ATP-grasp domain-containing protein [Verrucomicrobiota bacterium]|nr:ATP-grasp domain-containing protein [Verrucomicrobiota bacterium]